MNMIMTEIHPNFPGGSFRKKLPKIATYTGAANCRNTAFAAVVYLTAATKDKFVIAMSIPAITNGKLRRNPKYLIRPSIKRNVMALRPPDIAKGCSSIIFITSGEVLHKKAAIIKPIVACLWICIN